MQSQVSNVLGFRCGAAQLGLVLASIAALHSFCGCGSSDAGATGTSPPSSFVQQRVAPVEDCAAVKLSGAPDLDSAYAEVRGMHFYRYGNGHPYCESTAHILAYQGVVEHGLPLRKLIIRFTEAYREACRKEPEFAWHTVVASPAKDSKGGYRVLDPVYLCGIEDLSDYLAWYVKSDCPEFVGDFAGCAWQTEEEWRASTAMPASTHCAILDVPPWYYEFFNCSYNLGEPWDEARLARAFSYIRTDRTGTMDYGSRPGASFADYGCDFEAGDGLDW